MMRILWMAFVALIAFAPDAAAVYDARTGRWLQRDPIGYADGANLYRYGLASPVNYTDAQGLASVRISSGVTLAPEFSKLRCSISECINTCVGTRHSITKERLCRMRCEDDARTFENWYKRNRDLSWTSGLDDCPCRIDKDGSNPDPGKWNDPSTNLHGFHVGAKYCMRSKAKCGRANQCCYDEDGKLITHGSGSGSADLGAVETWFDYFWGNQHKTRDVDPAKLARKLDGGGWGCYSEAYLEVRPQVGSSKCPKNP